MRYMYEQIGASDSLTEIPHWWTGPLQSTNQDLIITGISIDRHTLIQQETPNKPKSKLVFLASARECSFHGRMNIDPLFHFHIISSASLSSQLQDKTERERKQRQKEQRDHSGSENRASREIETEAQCKHQACPLWYRIVGIKFGRRIVCDLGPPQQEECALSWPNSSDLNCVVSHHRL